MTPNVNALKSCVLINGERLDLRDRTVFLGITRNAKLQWGPHTARLTNRNSAVFAVKEIRQIADEDTARVAYFSYFHSVISYGI